MTEDSPRVTRGYGPFEEGAEPTAPIPAQPTAPIPAQRTAPIPAQRTAPIPAQPTAPIPAQPTASTPAQPTASTPAQPTASTPAQPSESFIAQPTGAEQTERATPAPSREPSNPAGGDLPHRASSDPRPPVPSSGPPQSAEAWPPAADGPDPATEHIAPVISQNANGLPFTQDGGTSPTAAWPPPARPTHAEPDASAFPTSGSDSQITTAYSPQPTTPYPPTPTGGPVGGGSVSGWPANGEPARGWPVSGAPASREPVGREPVGREPVGREPVSREPVSAEPASGWPNTGAPNTGAPNTGAPNTGEPTSGTPSDSTPVSGTPYAPTSGSPHPDPASGAPYPTPDAATPSYGPFRTGGTPTWDNPPATTTPDPYDFTSPTPFTGRRIEPSPPPDRSRLLIGLVAGLVAGLLVFGTAGWFGGRASAPRAAPTAAPTPTPTTSLGVFEQSQVALNQPHFAATGLVTIAQGWLPYLSACGRSGEPGGPTLNQGEKTRVRCTLDGMSAIFVEYDSIADRDRARVKTLGQNVDARSLTPGVGPAVQRSTPSGRTTGNYVEYAYKLTEGGVTRPVAGIWWDDAQTPVAGYLLAYWKEGLGESWDPMRDLWARYA